MKCPVCEAELEITDRWMPGSWMVRCPRYACILPFYVQETTRELALKAFFNAADNWKRNHKEEVEQFKKQLHDIVEQTR